MSEQTGSVSGIELRPCPTPGSGVHRWIYYAAHRAIEAGLDDTESVALIRGAMSREPGHYEIESTLNTVREERGTNTQVRLKWPARNREQVDAICAGGHGLAALHEQSPVRFDLGSNHAEEIIDILFPGNPLLCVGRNKLFARPFLRENLNGRLAEMQFIVPSPMSSTMGKSKSGGVSRRCEDNTGERKFLVVEFDSGSLDQQAALLFHLGCCAPLALVVFSGSKSLHGWFYCRGQDQEMLVRFMQYAVFLGADSATWTRCQLVRMPDGKREGGKMDPEALAHIVPNLTPGRQCVLYFNPGVLR